MIEDFKHQASKDTKKIKNVILGALWHRLVLNIKGAAEGVQENALSDEMRHDCRF